MAGPKPDKKDVGDELLESLLGKEIKIFLTSTIALTGKLIRYDSKSLQIANPEDADEPTIVSRRHISSYCKATDKNRKTR